MSTYRSLPKLLADVVICLGALAVIANDASAAGEGVGGKEDALRYLPEDVDVVVSVRGDVFRIDPAGDKASRSESLAYYIAAHALGTVFRSREVVKGPPEKAEQETPKLVHSDAFERIVIVLSQRQEKPPDAKFGPLWNGWQGVVLLQTKAGTSAEKFLREFGLVRRLEGYEHAVTAEGNDKEPSPIGAGVLSEQIAVFGESPKVVEHFIVASRAAQKARQASFWSERQPDPAAVFWLGRKPKVKVAFERDLGFIAASRGDDAMSVTYLYPGKRKLDFNVGDRLERNDRPFHILDYGAKFLVTEVAESKLVCEVRLDRDRGGAAALATIFMNVEIAAYPPGSLSP